ncbi:MAG TPA: autotransporter outer membrane beta-barrel domain-containing protein, partial [Alphaproteobacteria bacterium]|nr:autotransporter outer membrane beta-barrel domain-containing protein [Alphaproteobacteria bacterium]
MAQSQGGTARQSMADDPWGSSSGVSAGAPAKNWGFWSDGSGSYLDDNNAAVVKYSGSGITALAGVDYNLDNLWLFGFNAGYVRTDLNIPTLPGRRLANGLQLGPYISYIISSHFSADGIFNYTRLSNAASTLGHFDSDRFTGALNVNAYYDVEPFSLTGYFGYAYAVESPDSPTAPLTVAGMPTNIHYGTLKVGGEAAYPIGKFEPYLPVTFEYETTQTHDGTGRVAVVTGLGARYR